MTTPMAMRITTDPMSSRRARPRAPMLGPGDPAEQPLERPPALAIGGELVEARAHRRQEQRIALLGLGPGVLHGVLEALALSAALETPPGRGDLPPRLAVERGELHALQQQPFDASEVGALVAAAGNQDDGRRHGEDGRARAFDRCGFRIVHETHAAPLTHVLDAVLERLERAHGARDGPAGPAQSARGCRG